MWRWRKRRSREPGPAERRLIEASDDLSQKVGMVEEKCARVATAADRLVLSNTTSLRKSAGSGG